MTISKKITQFLDEKKVNYEIGEHPLAYTATEVASRQHIPGKQMIKSVIVKNNGQFIMCVLPAIHHLDFAKLKAVIGSKDLSLADEADIGKLFPEYELGAEPPFGQLYGLKVYADKFLENVEEVVFNAGTHTGVVKIKFADFKKVVNPVVAEIGTHV